ncbi:GDSL-type esterase/lipase family protein [Danxiaibacter flavus]|uniref:GDSL-type esterase/lipase family protein n=1 Tax=Danxiaibacter flavus TaxID=3049108 RepID=A0ABV3ZAE3_9BACT|nr:GDSL-type esterase/lipase family protein [Chitinophagaceae bacterium DXS]
MQLKRSTVKMIKQKILLAGITIASALPARAQQVDSSFHNYLYDSRLAYFNQLPVVDNTIIFWGDSITHWGDWAELLGFKKVLNRGIAGDNTYGLRGRIDEVLRHKPKKLFILIGTNDLNKKIPVSYIIDNYKKMIAEIKQRSSSTAIYVQSVFPINDSLIGRQYYSATNEQISELNNALQKMSAEQNVPYLNIHDALMDDKRQMAASYTYDGLHLSGKGYLAWIGYLKRNKFL